MKKIEDYFDNLDFIFKNKLNFLLQILIVSNQMHYL